MSDIAIKAESLSKSYRISHNATTGYRTLRESLVDVVRRPFRHDQPATSETIWALRDVSFEVHRGEALGIIGRNGAGKSTLLKILSRITRPTSGRADVYGRLGSLLEVGTGFHQELTGRENIYLNGAILGMSRHEIQRRFEEIVDFAETERFLDTPVKRYSTGMYMRLAFAVAAHLETDVLVVDEVLAVGDAAFQQKCLGKMEDVTGHGRTVLFVSHNMAAISQLCTSAILLTGGVVTSSGPVDGVVAEYMAGSNQEGHVNLRDRPGPVGSGDAVLEWAELRDRASRPRQDFSIGDDICVAFGLRVGPHRPKVKLVIAIRAADGTPIALVSEDDSGFALGDDQDRWDVSALFEDLRFYPGTYHVTIWLTDGSNSEEFDRAEDCLTFRMVEGGLLTMRWLPRYSGLLFLTPTFSARPGEPAGVPGTR